MDPVVEGSCNRGGARDAAASTILTYFLRQSATHLPPACKMLPLLLLSASIAASGPFSGTLANARTLRAGGVVTGSGRAPPPPQQHSGELFALLCILHSDPFQLPRVIILIESL